jgi:SAM-dependent methyltransferase
MKNLTDKSYWNQHWDKAEGATDRPPSFWKRTKLALRKAVGAERLSWLTLTYREHAFWKGLAPRFFGPMEGASVLEVGSAPGDYLVRLRDEFAVNPYGVEYAEVGVEQNKATFRRAGVPEDHVIFADAFSESFLKSHANQFDAVFSRGVIEHFTDPSEIIDAHIKVLKPGGILLISVPNYRWLCWLLKRTFDGQSIPEHNLNTMKPDVFAKAFEGRGLSPLFCGFYGTIDLGVSQPHNPGRLKWLAYMLCEKAQLPLNFVLRALFGTNGPNSRFTSPFLLYVGRKQG